MTSDWTSWIKTRAATLLVLWIVIERCCAQLPPANDEFTNRIALAGSAVVWTGNTAGATENLETDLDFQPPYVDWRSFSLNSVWWSWVAPVTTPVMVEVLGAFVPLRGYLAVYSLNPGESGASLCYMELQLHGQYATFQAEAGREYQIRLNLEETNDIVFRLTATNAPVFRLQPRTQTVSSNAGALFTAWAFGVKPLLYQWRYNGIDVPNATNAMLPIYYANATNAGEYCVVVSSAAGGTSTSTVARLMVSTNDLLPSVKALRLVGGTNFEFAVTGEEGRSYLVETSTNLIEWTAPQSHWAPQWLAPQTRLVVNNTNQTTQFQLTRNATREFFRLTPYHPRNEICNNHLKQLWFASWQFAEDQREDSQGGVTQVGLIPYLVDRVWPRCPLNPDIYPTDYIAMYVSYPTYCAYGHYLEEPPPQP